LDTPIIFPGGWNATIWGGDDLPKEAFPGRWFIMKNSKIKQMRLNGREKSKIRKVEFISRI
jgi:hypothetical protein